MRADVQAEPRVIGRRPVTTKSVSIRSGLVVAAIFVLAAQPGPTSYDRTQDQRITALEARLASPAPTTVPTATPRPAVVRTVSPGISAASLASLTTDLSIDVIELAPGTYHLRNCVISVDRSSRPLTIRSGGSVTFDAANDGDYGDAPFFVSGSHITFAGPFRFQHYLLAQAGLFTFVGASFINLQGITVRNVAGNTTAATEQSAHVLYVSRGSHDITADDFDVAQIQAIDEPGGVHGLNGLHVYTGGSGANVYNVSASRWRVDRANWAAVLRNATTGVLLDQWTVTNSGHAVPAVMDFGSDNLGRVSNVTTSGSLAPPVLWGRMTDVGGNDFR